MYCLPISSRIQPNEDVAFHTTVLNPETPGGQKKPKMKQNVGIKNSGKLIGACWADTCSGYIGPAV